MKRRLLAAATAAVLTTGITTVTIVGTTGTAIAKPMTCALIEPFEEWLLSDIVPPTTGIKGALFHWYFTNC
ncbi:MULTISPECIES: hypothetical protein [Pseudofrankia]|uniref:hypothetical protein n=1 Tax=Pseudofrankia TaxID=2994363 RepID=UPI000234BA27|nr:MULTISPECIES: hypothetical protein [Pseudofrankia]OHV40363.1 hypothetical protein BCD49_39740 [Pseudofrankia sp. EUN1h]